MTYTVAGVTVVIRYDEQSADAVCEGNALARRKIRSEPG
jgi:hypothetical protein